VFHSPAMTQIILDLLRDYLPTNQDFVIRNLRALADAHRSVQFASLVMLFITSTGVFLPLEVALNRVWGFPRNRSYLANQAVSLGLAFGAGALALVSVALAAGNQRILLTLLFGSRGIVFEVLGWFVMKVFAILASIAIFFLIYWQLPNGKVSAAAVAPAAVVTGLLWELAKYGYMLALPWLDLQAVYGPFAISVTLIMWAFLSGLLLLAGAHLSAQRTS